MLAVLVTYHPFLGDVAGSSDHGLNDRGPRASLRKHHGGRLSAQRGQATRNRQKRLGNPKENGDF